MPDPAITFASSSAPRFDHRFVSGGEERGQFLRAGKPPPKKRLKPTTEIGAKEMEPFISRASAASVVQPETRERAESNGNEVREFTFTTNRQPPAPSMPLLNPILTSRRDLPQPPRKRLRKMSEPLRRPAPMAVERRGETFEWEDSGEDTIDEDFLF